MLLSVIETAETLGCSAQYVRKLLREGRLAGQKIGDSWIINLSLIHISEPTRH